METASLPVGFERSSDRTFPAEIGLQAYVGDWSSTQSFKVDPVV